MYQNEIKQILVQSQSKFILLAISIVFSSFTLWLVESPIKYGLFTFEIFVILSLYAILKKSDDGSNLGFRGSIALDKIFRSLHVDVFLVISSFVLLVINAWHLEGGETIQLILSLLVSSVLSGYSLLNIFKIPQYLSKLEVLVLSYLVSFVFSGFCTLSLLSTDEGTRALVIPFLFILIGTFSIISQVKNGGYETKGDRPNSLSKDIDIIAISLSIIFYIIFFSLTYPNFTLIPGSDMSRHLSNSITLSRTPDLYTGHASYILFHSFEATLRTLSGFHQSITYFQTIQVVLNLLLPLSVYALAKRFFAKVDKRIPAISVIFYSVLSNFSFVYFTQLKLLQTSNLEVQLLGAEVADRAFNGTINFLQPFPWFVPLSISFVMFIAAFLLLRVIHIPRARFMMLYSIIILAMYITHGTEAVIFVIFLAIYALISKSDPATLRLNDALLSSLIAFLFATAIIGYISLGWGSDIKAATIPLNSLASVVLPIAIISISMVWRSKVSPHIRFTEKFTHKKFYSIASVVLVVAYLLGFQTWIFTDTFSTSTIYDVGNIPWFIYPLTLGVVGLLTVIAIRYLPDILPNSSVAIIAGAILIMLVMGKLVSFVNVNILITGYWEKRFLFYIYLFASMLAPIPLIIFADKIQTKMRRNIVANSTLMLVISLIVLLGFSSMVLQSVYWFTVVKNGSSTLEEKEFQAIDYLKNVLQHDTHAFVLTPTSQSSKNVVFAAPAYQFSLPLVPITSRYPEIPLLSLGAHNLDHAYIYVHLRDRDFLEQDLAAGWLTKHLLPMLPIVFSNGVVTIFNATHLSFPVANSDTSLLIPSDSRDDSWYYAYDILSQTGRNYTVIFDQSDDMLRTKNAILSFDPTLHYVFYDNFSSNDNYKNHQLSPISGNWKFLGDGLYAGDKSDKLQNILLSPISSKNFNMSTAFKINVLDPKITSYVSLIYSWVDDQNYQYAGITIYKNDVYLSFATVNNGKTSFEPSWPGLKTDLYWYPGELFNLTLSIIGNKTNDNHQERLFLNGINYLQREYQSKPGQLGLSYGRIQDIVFDDFKVQDSDELNQRKLSNYLPYLRSGGHLFVLNTNGYGSIAKYLSSLPESDFNRDHVERRSSVIDRLRHTEPSLSNISVSDAQIGLGKITYVDIYPILSNYMDGSTSAVMGYKILGNLSSLFNLSPYSTPPPNFKDIPAIFRKMFANGDINVNTSSIIFPGEGEFSMLNMSIGSDTLSVSNVTKLNIAHSENAILSTNKMSITDGRGLYANLLLGSEINDSSSLNLSFPGKQAVQVSVITNDGGLLHFGNVSNLNLMSKEPINIYVRQPTMRLSNANITFNELYPLELFAKGKISGQNLKINGSAILSIFMSDSYTLLSHVSVDGIVQRFPMPASFDELLLPPFTLSKLYSIPPLVRVLLLIPFILAAVLVMYGKNEKDRIVNVEKI